MLPELVLDAGVEVGWQHAPTASAIGVAITLGAVATQVRVYGTVHPEAHLVLMARTAPSLDANPVLRLLVPHRDHFFRVPYGD